RLRMNSAAAVSADGEQAKRGGRLPLRPKLLKDVVDFVANNAFDRNGCRILQESDLQLVQEPLQVCPGRHGVHGAMLARSRMHSPPLRGGELGSISYRERGKRCECKSAGAEAQSNRSQRIHGPELKPSYHRIEAGKQLVEVNGHVPGWSDLAGC